MAHFARDVFRTSLTQGVMIGAGILAGVLTARVLGPDGRGLYSLGLSITMTAVLFGGFELGQSLVYSRGQKRESEASLIAAGLVAPLFLGVITVGAMAVIWPLLSEALELLPLDLLLLSIALIPISLSGMAVRQLFRAFDDFDRFNGLRVLAPISRVLLLAIAFLLGGGVREALVAVFAAETFLFVVGTVMLVRRARPDFGAGLRLVPGLFRFGLKLESASALGYASARITVFAVAYYLDADAIAFYAVADGLVQQISGLPMIVGTVLLPKISGVTEQSRAELTVATHRVILFVLAVLAVGVWFLGHWVILGLYGEAYSPAVAALSVLLLSMVFQSGNRVLSPYLTAVNRIEIQVVIQAVSLAVHVVLLLLWVPSGGIVGAAWATAAATGVRWVLHVGAFTFFARIPIHRIVLVNADDGRRFLAAAREQFRAATS